MTIEIKDCWEIREWVEEAITEEQCDRDLNWSEIHYDKFGKEYDEVHRRESKQWVSLDSLKEFLEDELISEQEEATTKWSSEEERHIAAKKYEIYESLLTRIKEYEKEEEYERDKI